AGRSAGTGLLRVRDPRRVRDRLRPGLQRRAPQLAVHRRLAGMTILHLLPDFDYSSAARQVAVLAPALRTPDGGSNILHAAAPGPTGPVADWLKAAGVAVHALGRRRRFAFAAGWQLLGLLAELNVDVVHAWRRPAWRAAMTLPRRASGPALVVSQPLRGGRALPLDRWVLRRADRVVAENAAEADAIRATGVSFDRVATIPLAVSQPSSGCPVVRTAGIRSYWRLWRRVVRSWRRAVPV